VKGYGIAGSRSKYRWEEKSIQNVSPIPGVKADIKIHYSINVKCIIKPLLAYSETMIVFN
jgi:hypothetical protein